MIPLNKDILIRTPSACPCNQVKHAAALSENGIIDRTNEV
jgi:hypothetical protein